MDKLKEIAIDVNTREENIFIEDINEWDKYVEGIDELEEV
jgi:hypothetical protein